jgi:hypothetical protein
VKIIICWGPRYVIFRITFLYFLCRMQTPFSDVSSKILQICINLLLCIHMDAYERCTNLGGGVEILPVVLPSMFEAETFSDHLRTILQLVGSFHYFVLHLLKRYMSFLFLRSNTTFLVANFNSYMYAYLHVILGCMFIDITSVCQ